MEIRELKEDKKQFLSLLLLADEQEDMIDRYIEKGTVYVLDDDGAKCQSCSHKCRQCTWRIKIAPKP